MPNTDNDNLQKAQIDEIILHSPQDWEGIFNTITDVITIHDKDFNIIYANNEAKKILALPDLEMTKAIKCYNYYHGTICPPKGCPSCDCVLTGIPAVFELFEPHLEKHVEIRAIPRYDNEKQIIGVIHILRDITERKHSEEELRSSREKLRNLAAHLNSVREEERTLIAREIHDELAQTLTALKMGLVWLNKKLPEVKAPLTEKIESMSSLIDMTIYTVRRISSELRPGLLDDLGLQAAIEWQAKEFGDRTGITCEVTFHSDISNLDQKRSTALFRIFQETLTNVVRHAEATEVRASLEETPEMLIMKVKDNGVGITEEEILNSNSFGIIGMQERTLLLGGNIKLKGVRDKGTTVTASIPID